MDNEPINAVKSEQGVSGVILAQTALEEQIKEVNEIATEFEGTSKKMVQRSIRYDALTVIFSAASPALTTYIAYEENLGPYGAAIKLSVILVVAIAVSLPALKRILGIKKQATHTSASAMELRKAIAEAHTEMSRIGEDIKEEKQEKYYRDQIEILKSKVSEVQQKHSRLIFDIMEESHGIAEQESKKIKEIKQKESDKT